MDDSTRKAKQQEIETITRLLGETLHKMGYKIFITSFCIASDMGILAGGSLSWTEENPILIKSMFADMCRATLNLMEQSLGEEPLYNNHFNQF